MSLLSEADSQALRKLFQERLQEPVVLHFFAQGADQSSQATRQILAELAELHEAITVQHYDFSKDQQVAGQFRLDKAPALVVAQPSYDFGIRFYGVPSGYEFSSLVEDIVDVSRGEADLPEEVIQALQALKGEVRLQVFVTPTCPYCPRAVRTAHKFALASEQVTGDMVMATDFNELSFKYGVSAVPHIVVNETASFVGALPEQQFLAETLKGVHTAD